MRWVAAIVGGLLAGIFLYFLGSMLAGSAQIWLFYVGWIGLGLFFFLGGPAAWPRAWLTLSIESFALPIAALVMYGSIGAEEVSKSASEAEAAGAAVGSFIGGGIVTGLAGFVGFFLGVIFALLAYFTYKGAKEWSD